MSLNDVIDLYLTAMGSTGCGYVALVCARAAYLRHPAQLEKTGVAKFYVALIVPPCLLAPFTEPTWFSLFLLPMTVLQVISVQGGSLLLLGITWRDSIFLDQHAELEASSSEWMVSVNRKEDQPEGTVQRVLKESPLAGSRARTLTLAIIFLVASILIVFLWARSTVGQ